LPLEVLQERVTIEQDAYAAARNAHAVVILTEWDEFRQLDPIRLREEMLKPGFVFDGRNTLPAEKVSVLRPDIYGIGKPGPGTGS
jgi:UDPglucose 6-dehydrogenase